MRELGSLVRWDHDDLHYALRVMTEPLSDEVHVASMLDRITKTFPAHVEAEATVLARLFDGGQQRAPALYFLASQITAAHLAQESALKDLAMVGPKHPGFRERARYLRALMVHHADHEAACFQPALPDHVPRELYHALAGVYSDRRARYLETQPLRRVG